MNYARAEMRKLLTLPSLRLTALLTWAGTALLALAPAPLTYAQAGFLVLGVLAATSEHQAGDQIRTTLLAMPRRLRLSAAKAGTLAVATFPVAAVTVVIADVPQAPAATAYLICTTLLAAAVGGLVRHAVPALVPLLVLYFVVGPLLRTRLAGYLPDTAALEPATVVWTLSAVALAALTLARRDA